MTSVGDMYDDGYQPTYHELSPVSLSENEHFAPLTPSENDSSLTAGQKLEPESPAVNVDNVIEMLQSASQNAILDGVPTYHVSRLTEEQLQQLLVLFRGLPLTFFIGSLKRAYGECEAKLDSVRTDLFELVKQKENCPYQNSEIKKRIQTRNGEQLTDKLSRDIHTLLSVVDGEEFLSSEMRELVSTKKPPRSISGVSTDETHSPARPKTQASDVSLVQDMVSGLRADLLCFKQVYSANESARSEQIKLLKDTTISLKSDLNHLRESVLNNIREIKLCVHRIENERVSCTVKMKNELKLLNENVRSVEDNLDCAVNNLSLKIDNVSSKKGSTKAHKKANLAKQADTGFSMNTSKNIPESNMSNSNIIDLCSPDQTCIERDSCTDKATTSGGSFLTHSQNNPRADTNVRPQVPMSSSVIEKAVTHQSLVSKSPDPNPRSDPTTLLTLRPDSHSGNPQLGVGPQSQLTNSPPKDPVSPLYYAVRADNRAHSVSQQGEKSLPSSGVSGPNKTTVSHSVPNIERTIPTRVTNAPIRKDSDFAYRNFGISGNISGSAVCGGVDDDEGEFRQFVRRRVKSFFIGGFKGTITEDKLSRYVSKRGPSVAKIYVVRNKIYDSAYIKLTVEDNEQAVWLENPYFWPEGVRCRPWKVRRGYERAGPRDFNAKTSFQQNHGPQPLYQRSDINDYNPYLCLDNDN